MLKTAFDLKSAVNYVAKNITNVEFQRHSLNNKEWDSILGLINIFEIFVKPTTKLQSQTYTISNEGLLYIYQIYNKLETIISTLKSK